ncbi:MAG: S1C family serine protease [Bradymonadia bacterium]
MRLSVSCVVLALCALTGAATAQRATPREVTPRGPLSPEEKRTIKVFEQTSPSVVFISTSERVYRQTFRALNAIEIPRGTGTGFVWDEQGHVVTNFHVIAGGDRVTVTFNDQETVPAKVVGADPDKDLAVLLVDPKKVSLKPIKIGRSSELRVGQQVLAIGNPFGLDQSLTTGVVSALDRSIPASTNRTIEGVIQTDAAINPGNSGGPLLDSAGRLIGVNTAIRSPSGANAGIGFAVPVDTVNRVVPQLIMFRETRRPTLGVEVNDRLPRKLMRMKGGVLIMGVVPGSGAEKAGLMAARRDRKGGVVGDVIVALDGKEVLTLDALLNQLESHAPGDEVKLTVKRRGKLITVPVKLSARRR